MVKFQLSIEVCLSPDGGISAAVLGVNQMGNTSSVQAHEAPAVIGRIAPPITMQAATAAWAEDLRLQGRTPLHSSRAVAAVNTLAEQHGWRTPADIETAQLRAWISGMADRGLAGKTRNTARGYLHRFLAFCIAQAWIATNPAKGVGRARVIKRKARHVPTEDEIRRLIEAARKDWRTGDRWLVYLTAATTGLRWETLKRLQWHHVQLEQHPPRIDLPGAMLKAREPGTVFLTAELAEQLRRHRAGTGTRPTVFKNVPKWDGMERDRRRAGIPKGNERDPDGATFSFHSLRHFASNRMLWAGRFTDAERAQQNTHQSESMTREVYTDPAHENLGKKVFSMEPLLPQGFAHKTRGRKKTATPECLLTNGGTLPDTLGSPISSSAKSQNDDHRTRADVPAARLDPTCGLLPGSDGHNLGLSADSLSAGQGEAGNRIGVSGFEPHPSTATESLVTDALQLAALAISVANQLRALGRPRG